MHFEGHKNNNFAYSAMPTHSVWSVFFIILIKYD